MQFRCTIIFATLIAIGISPVIVKWFSLPDLPETVAYRKHRKVIDFVVSSMLEIGMLFEHRGIATVEKVVRSIMGVGERSINTEKYGDPAVSIERSIIENIDILKITPRGHCDEKLPTVVYLHGGGWAFGTFLTHLPFTSWLSKTAHAKVIAVDFSLPPDVHYRRQIDECVQITRRMIADEGEGGVFVAGDSSGANLAASVAMHLKWQLRGVLLLSPGLQVVNFTLPSNVAYRHLFEFPELFTAKRAGFSMTPGIQVAINWGRTVDADTRKRWNSDYLNVSSVKDYEFPSNSAVRYSSLLPKVKLTEQDKLAIKVIGDMVQDPFAYPLIADDELLRGMAPHFIQACEIDQIRDDAFLYAHRLQRLGVPVNFNYLKDAIHTEPVASFAMPSPPGEAAQKGRDAIIAFLADRVQKKSESS